MSQAAVQGTSSPGRGSLCKGPGATYPKTVPLGKNTKPGPREAQRGTSGAWRAFRTMSHSV